MTIPWGGLKKPTVWLQPSDHDIQARRAIAVLTGGSNSSSGDIEVLRRIAELAGDSGLDVAFVRENENGRKTEYSVVEMLAATRGLDSVIETRPPDRNDSRRTDRADLEPDTTVVAMASVEDFTADLASLKKITERLDAVSMNFDLQVLISNKARFAASALREAENELNEMIEALVKAKAKS